ncbi:MAG: magnesium/cobalt transporter CorA [Bacteroidetes bacterium]|nr:magnesium/cobalt transporter CorA [Bacteroidota bacterium]
MSEKINRKKVAPGEFRHIGKRKLDKVKMQLYMYNKASHSVNREFQLNDLEQIDLTDGTKIKWLNIYGLHDLKIIGDIGEKFRLDAMVLEDLLNTTHRPKVEEYADHLFFTLKILNRKQNLLDTEQVSFILSHKHLISFQEKIGDFFDHIRNRIENDLGPIRNKQADFLFYLMLDSLLDNYYQLNDDYHAIYSALNEEVFDRPGKETGKKIENAKNDILFIKKTLAPLKEAILKLGNEGNFIQSENKKYFSDLRDSVLEINESFETQWHLFDSTFNLHFTLINNKANDIMKVLTIIATIFIPLTFFAGVYGMNFHYMPELGWEYSYPIFWLLMILLFAGTVIFFRKKKWL